MNANNSTIFQIVNSSRQLRVPFFQRAYVWGEEQWERFLNDMKYISSSGISYFMGSLILKQEQTCANAMVGDVRTIIDGQQRLTTIAIFLKVLSLKERTYKNYFEGCFFTISKDSVIQHSHNDVVAFEMVLKQTTDTKINNVNNSKIISAYNYFVDEISNPADYQFFTITNKMTFVCINLDFQDDEQKIFDTVNSVGVSLTTAELLKNYFFDRNTITSYEKYWKDVFEKDEDTVDYWEAGGKRTNLDYLLFSYLTIKLQDKSLGVTAADKAKYGKYDGLFNNYQDYIKNYYQAMGYKNVDEAKKGIVIELNSYAVTYKNFIDRSIVNRHVSATDKIERINAVIWGIDTTVIIPYILFVLKNQPDNRKRDELFSLVESFLMRRMLCKCGTKNYNNFFSDTVIGNSILDIDDLRKKMPIVTGDINEFPSDIKLESAFHNEKLSNKQAKGLLYMLESGTRNSQKNSTTLLGIEKYSLEHMMPKKWRNKWPMTINPIATDDKLLTLGNLTIISGSLNTSIRDSGWQSKLKGTKGKGGLLQYGTGIEISNWAFNQNVWNESMIDKRANDLFQLAFPLWKY